MADGIGDRFQKDTKYQRGRLPAGSSIWQEPELYKEYPGKPKIKLPQPKPSKDANLYDTLKKRRSIRSFSEKPISLENLSYLLWAANGIVRKESGYEFRTAPSAGALYPVETYLVVNNVESVAKGVYHYLVKKHELEELKRGDFREEIARAALDQYMCAESAVVLIWTGIFRRSKWKYGDRAYRYVYLDAGHIAENVALASAGLGLGNCQVGALFDDEVNAIIDVDGREESVIYMTTIGHFAR